MAYLILRVNVTVRVREGDNVFIFRTGFVPCSCITSMPWLEDEIPSEAESAKRALENELIRQQEARKDELMDRMSNIVFKERPYKPAERRDDALSASARVRLGNAEFEPNIAQQYDLLRT